MVNNEKLPLVQHVGDSHARPIFPWKSRTLDTFLRASFVGGSLLICLMVMDLYLYPVFSNVYEPLEAQCRQVEPLLPSKKTPALSKMDEYLDTAQFRNLSVARLAGAVQIPSQSYDDLGPVGEDKRWDTMFDVAAYLKKTFPLIHSTIQLEKVNTHGLLYTWKGSDDTLKPTVLMAHQDVVPVPDSTVNQWTYPPFSGTYDGHFVWGRGSNDCKNTLIGILSAVELLIEAGFEPKRTLILSFGFDEESSGKQGAGHLADAIHDRYGSNGVAVIVDEGGGTTDLWGSLFALPAVTEKGYVDVEVIVRMPGGHSSIPPPHNGIGVMSELITVIEANRYEPHFATENPFLGALQCAAAHSPDFPSKWKKLLPSKGDGSPRKREKLAYAIADTDDPIKYLFTTSVAVDIIGGGVKANALPERTTALVNHRINIGDRVSDVEVHLTKLATKVANKYNLTLHAFEEEGETPSSITLHLPKGYLDPAPVTPTDLSSLSPFAVLSGTTRALYGDEVLIAPALMTGNTDTRYYWDVTEHIFRFQPGYDPEEGGLAGVHTVDEKASMLNHIRGVKWFTLFIRNMDEVDFE
ncbi:vacuolar carboxypeptidase-like protein Cps1 [Xylariales sp. AK1849]|nr:vacuolar carboxypeptidase-like protein Cps1 [Xylariales sp. AK1849]